MKPAPEQYRLKKHPLLGSDSSYGNNGFFVIPHWRINNYEIACQISDGMGWEHVSVTVSEKRKEATRCPTWAEMCFVKDLFWNKDEWVIQFHPATSEYVSQHEFCLHLWKPVGIELPKPESIMVGINGMK
jgi:hypothetical protein